jgi:hypothetical protein
VSARCLLVTTSHSVLRLAWPSLARDAVIHRGDGLYYGIAQTPWGLAIAARRRLVSSAVPPADERGCVLLFDAAHRPAGELHAPFPLRDLHGMAHFAGALWLTCSFDNQIVRFDGTSWEAWQPLGRPESAPFDVNHFNTLWPEDGDLWVLAHNFGASRALRYRLPGRELAATVDLGNQAHDLWRRPGGALATCSSMDGTLVASDGWTLPTGGFPRGIAFDGERMVVGISELAERDHRDFTTGRLAVVEPDGTVARTVELPGEGLVLALALVEAPRG